MTLTFLSLSISQSDFYQLSFSLYFNRAAAADADVAIIAKKMVVEIYN